VKVIEKNLPHIFIFMMLFLTSSYHIYRDALSSVLTMGLWVLLFGVMLLRLKKIVSNHMVVFLTFIIIYVVSSIYNNENMKQLLSYFLAFVCAFLFTEIYGYKHFTKSFVDVMRFLCIVSLVCLALYTLFPSLGDVFTLTTSGGKRVPSILFYTHSSTRGRNGGMFWEPGAYQTFILLALLFEVLEDKLNVFDFSLFLITVATTFSTTGYLGAACIVLIIFMKRNFSNKRIKNIVFFASVVVIVYFIINPDFLFKGENSVFGKIIYFFETRAYENYGVNQTAVVRFYAVIKPFEAFLESPLLGKGITGLKEYTYAYTLGMNTCTFINYFATFGFLYGSLSISAYIGLIKKHTKDFRLGLMVFLFFVLITFSENYIYNGFFFMILLYGFHS